MAKCQKSNVSKSMCRITPWLVRGRPENGFGDNRHQLSKRAFLWNVGSCEIGMLTAPKRQH